MAILEPDPDQGRALESLAVKVALAARDMTLAGGTAEQVEWLARDAIRRALASTAGR